MHSAPAVSYPVGRSAMRAGMLLLPWIIGGLVCSVWIAASDRPHPVYGLGLVLWLAGVIAALRAVRRPAIGVLRWDGQQWHWEMRGAHLVGGVHCRLDWQQGLLLEFAASGGAAHWLWLERNAHPMYWDALRRAVRSPGAVSADPAATSPAGGVHG